MSTPAPSPATPGFDAFALSSNVQQAVQEIGYQTPSAIQAAAIPPLLEGRDVLGQAQTGTGKTAAFALPLLSRLNPQAGAPQALVLAPTRELALQVTVALEGYARHIQGFRIQSIYGGQSYQPQLRGLRRGVHVVVGTPGRVIDHINKGTLDLSGIRFAVLDEADEMLRMGFAEDVDTILSAMPTERQNALFSATMPGAIRRIARSHLRQPVEVSIGTQAATSTHIRQRYWKAAGLHKLDALTRILEVEPVDAAIVFARTRQATDNVAEQLQQRGFSAAAIHGDIAQPQRERLVRQLRDGALDVLVATDVAARGLDVERISHVFNYDAPHDVESYVHRIGRTGRAGRPGEAVLFITGRDQRKLYAIERATKQKLERLTLPTAEAVNERRVQRFVERIHASTQNDDLAPFRKVIERYTESHDTPLADVAAALACLAHGKGPLLAKANDKPLRAQTFRDEQDHTARPRKQADNRRPPRAHEGEAGKDTYRLEVGHRHGAQPKNIIGAIANEAGLDSRYIGRLSIRQDFSLIDLPEGMPRELLQHLKKVRVAGQPLRMSPDTGSGERRPRPKSRPQHAQGRNTKGKKRGIRS